MLKKGEIALYLDDKGQLLPADGESAERYLKLERNKVFIFTFKKVRNYKFLKKYYSLIKLAFDNQDIFSNKEWFRKWTLISIGYCDEFIDPFTGIVSYTAKSVSFDKCSEVEFEEVYKNTVSLFMGKFCFDNDFFNVLRSYD